MSYQLNTWNLLWFYDPERDPPSGVYRLAGRLLKESLARRAGTPALGLQAPDAMEFGCPGRGSNHIMPLFMSMPPCGSTTLEPKRFLTPIS